MSIAYTSIQRTEHYVLVSAKSKVSASFHGSSVLDREREQCADLPVPHSFFFFISILVYYVKVPRYQVLPSVFMNN